MGSREVTIVYGLFGFLSLLGWINVLVAFYILVEVELQESLAQEIFIGMHLDYMKVRGLIWHSRDSNCRALLPPCYGLNCVSQKIC